jgi:K+-sensing histidine kinase KdpD
MVKNDTVNNAMGSGLGLSICKSLAISMNMQISSKSTFGQGSIFSLAIPMMPERSSRNNPERENVVDLHQYDEVLFKDDLENIEV